MSDLKAALTHKVGPLPAGAWAGAILGGLGISYYLRRHPRSAAASTTDVPDVTTASEAVTGGTGGAAVSLPGNISGPVDTGDSAGTVEAVAITSNALWRQQAVKWLVGNGVGAIAAEQAIANYLAGGTLSQDQADNINKVIAAVGPTPDAVPTISVAGPPAPPATPGPPVAHAITTNAEWRAAALAWMVHNGHNRAGSAAALDDYLHGRGIGPLGLVAVRGAIAAVGQPPQHVAPPHGHKDTGKHTNPKR